HDRSLPVRSVASQDPSRNTCGLREQGCHAAYRHAGRRKELPRDGADRLGRPQDSGLREAGDLQLSLRNPHHHAREGRGEVTRARTGCAVSRRTPGRSLVDEAQSLRAAHVARLESLESEASLLDQPLDWTVEMAAAIEPAPGRGESLLPFANALVGRQAVL